MKLVPGQYGVEYELSTGKRLEPHQAILGLAPTGTNEDDPEGTIIYGGYDQVLVDAEHCVGYDAENVLTAAELTELADFMIAQWSAFRAHFVE